MSNASDFVIEKNVLVHYQGSEEHVVIPEGITKIAPRIFWNNNNVKSIVVADTVREIGFRTFSGCGKLEKIILSASLKKIPNEAFSFCPELKSVQLSDRITEIGKNAFCYCSKLESIAIPEGVTEIGECAFSMCKNLKKVYLPESLVSLGNSAFASCEKLEDINIPDSLTNIGLNAFFNTAVPMIIIHNELLNCNCDGDVVIPDGVEVIKSVTQCGKAIKSISIPESVSVIEEGAIIYFDGNFTIKCSSEKWNLLWESLGKSKPATKVEFCHCYLRSVSDFSNDCKRILNYLNREKEKVLEFIIKANDENSLANILNIVKPLTPDAIENYIKKCEKSAGMAALLIQYRKEKYSDKEIQVIKEDKIEKELGIKERTVADWKEIFTFKVTDGKITINSYKGKDTFVEVPEFIGKNPVIAIGKNAFSQNNRTCDEERKKFFREELTTVILPDSVTVIGENAFSYCKSLVEVRLPSKLEKIGEDAFYECKSLLQIDLPDTLTTIGRSVFTNCESLQEIKIPSKIKEIEAYTFLHCKNLKKIGLPDGLKAIGDDAFSGCESLNKVDVPSTLENISKTAFSFCKNLADKQGFVTVAGIMYNYYGDDSKVSLPQNIFAIGDRAFENNKTIKKVIIPEGVTSVGFRAFANCPELEIVLIPNSLKSTEKYTFYECPKLKFSVPKGKEAIVDYRGSVHFTTE